MLHDASDERLDAGRVRAPGAPDRDAGAPRDVDDGGGTGGEPGAGGRREPYRDVDSGHRPGQSALK
ncbi:MAG: hypothetical protein ABI568_01155, partial [Pseudarthrobacter sp.]